MNILLTGGTGFVGRAIHRRLLSEGHLVTLLTRSPNSAPHILIDLEDPASVSAAAGQISQADALVHCAAGIDMGFNTVGQTSINCAGTHALFELAQSLKVNRVVLISSIAVYGPPKGAALTEKDIPKPMTVYGATKLFAEALLPILQQTGISASALRVSAPIGPEIPGERVIAVMVDKALRGEQLPLYGKGSRVQNYVDVEDVASGVINALEKNAIGPFNIGGAVSISNLNLIKTIKSLVGGPSEIVSAGKPDPGDGQTTLIDLVHAKSELGYEPKVSLEQTLKRIIDARQGAVA